MRLTTCLTTLLLACLFAIPVAAQDDARWKQANQSIDKGIAYLRTQQAEDGSWMAEIGPAVTGLALTALLEQKNIGPNDPAAAKAITYILERAQEDGSIRNEPDGILASYNTAICLSALARVGNDPAVAEVIRKGQEFLRGTQWIIGMTDPNGNVIDENHPFVGGFGYGKHGRPDLSNTQIALQAMHDTGVDCDDPVFQRALTFLNKLQATEDNALYADKLEEHDGGFIYAPSVNSANINKPESKANQDQIDEAKAGRDVSGLRTYGGMTYAGFKSLLYADLDRDDKRVQAALSWISNNYKLDRNPGMPEEAKLQGLYYYYMTMARAMNAYGSSSVTIRDYLFATDPDVNPHLPGSMIALDTLDLDTLTLGETFEIKNEDTDIPATAPKLISGTHATTAEGKKIILIRGESSRDWSNDLIDMIAKQQAEDGSWRNSANRWLEDQPVLVTAYSIIALQNAID